jgi:HAE1 family hydrophobic/amphiphilic exporter-1
MTFPELGIKRYVMAFMSALIIIVVGIVSWQRIGIEETPNVEFPYITVVATQSGADAEIIDNTITSVLIESLNGIPGLVSIKGESRNGVGYAVLEFELSKSIDIAFSEVQVKVNQSLSSLPSGIDQPQILKNSVGGNEFIRIVVYGDRTYEQLTEYIKNNIKPNLENIKGVSNVDIFGAREKKVIIKLDQDKMAKFGIAVNEISSALRSSHIQYAAGYIVGESKDISLKLDFEYRNIDDLKNLVIKKGKQSFIRLKDIANISIESDNLRSYSAFKSIRDTDSLAYNSLPSLTLGIYKIPGSNAFSIEQNVQELLNTSIIPSLEPGLKLLITYNETSFIKRAVNTLQKHLVEGVGITALIVLLILANLRSTLIIAFSIPISLLGAIVVMYAFGYTFNILTLLALLLLIGVVVDDSIIVLENIYKKMEHGIPPKQAAIEGSNQIVFAVLASTLSLICIFGPVVFMDGIVGRFFQGFAVVVTFGVVISYFVSMFITPMLCAYFLKYSHKKNIIARMLEDFFAMLDKGYEKLLTVALKNRLIVLAIAASLFFIVFKWFAAIPFEFTPSEDYSSVRISIEAPTSTNLYYTINKIKEVEDIVAKYDQVLSLYSRVGGNNNKGSISVSLVPLNQRTVSQTQFIQTLREALRNIVGVKVTVGEGRGGGGPGGSRVAITLVGSNLNEIYDYSNKLVDIYQQNPNIVNASSSLDKTARVRILDDKNQIAILGVSSIEIAQAIATLNNGSKIGKFNQQGDNNRYDIILRSQALNIKNSQDLNKFYITSSNNKLISLNNLLKIEEYYAINTIIRDGSLYSTTINIDPVPNIDALKLGTETIETAKNILPNSISVKIEGNSKELSKTINNVLFAFTLAVVLLYMVLASQFNSFIQPFVLMMTIPLAIIGGILALNLTHLSLNIYSMIGMILLVGLVVKNAILLVDLTNELREKGNNIKDALIKACPVRLRPILMTSLTVIFTMVPSAISKAEGSASNASLSMAVIGGMLSSTILTLIVIPVLYSFVEGGIERAKRLINKLFRDGNVVS